MDINFNKPIPTYGQQEIKEILGWEIEAPEFTEEEINFWNSASPFDKEKKVSEVYKVVLIPGGLSLDKIVQIFVDKTTNHHEKKVLNRFPEKLRKKLVGPVKPYWLYISPLFQQRNIKLTSSIEDIEKQTKKNYRVATSSRLPACVEIVFCTLLNSLDKKLDLFDKKFILCKEELKSDKEIEEESLLKAQSSSVFSGLNSAYFGTKTGMALNMMNNQQNLVNSMVFKSELQATNHLIIQGLFNGKLNWKNTQKSKIPDQVLVWQSSK